MFAKIAIILFVWRLSILFVLKKINSIAFLWVIPGISLLLFALSGWYCYLFWFVVDEEKAAPIFVLSKIGAALCKTGVLLL